MPQKELELLDNLLQKAPRLPLLKANESFFYQMG